MVLWLYIQDLVEESFDFFITATISESVTKINGNFRKETGADFPICRQSNAIASIAEVMANGMDKPNHARSAGNPEILRRPIIIFIGPSNRDQFSELCFDFIDNCRKTACMFLPKYPNLHTAYIR